MIAVGFETRKKAKIKSRQAEELKNTIADALLFSFKNLKSAWKLSTQY
jgi:hypothetical protein